MSVGGERRPGLDFVVNLDPVESDLVALYLPLPPYDLDLKPNPRRRIIPISTKTLNKDKTYPIWLSTGTS